MGRSESRRLSPINPPSPASPSSTGVSSVSRAAGWRRTLRLSAVTSDVGPIATLPLWVIRHRDLSHGAVRLLGLILASGEATTQELADEFRLSVITVNRWMRDLVRAGALRVYGGHGSSKRYSVCLADCTINAEDTDGVNRGTLLNGQELGAPGGGGGEALKHLKQEPTRIYRRSTSTSTVRTTTRFDQFYSTYPKHVCRTKAGRAFLKTNAESDTDVWVQLMSGLHRWMKLWTAERRESKFIPHPATFLNQRQWEDECDVPEPRPHLTKQTEGMVAATAHFLQERQVEDQQNEEHDG